jgi:hypothetical protein
MGVTVGIAGVDAGNLDSASVLDLDGLAASKKPVPANSLNGPRTLVTMA